MENTNRQQKLKQELENMVKSIDFNNRDEYLILWEVRDKLETIQFKYAPLTSDKDWN